MQGPAFARLRLTRSFRRLVAHACDERGEMRRRRAAAASEYARPARGPARRELAEVLRRQILAAAEAELVFGHAQVRVDPERQRLRGEHVETRVGIGRRQAV